MFVTELSEAGNSLVYSTYLGGKEGSEPRSIAVDSQGDAYVAGWTWSEDFPTKNALFEWPHGDAGSGAMPGGFVTEIGPAGASLVFSTFFGGNIEAIAVDVLGNSYVTGGTVNPNFPTRGALYPTPAGQADAFVSEIASGGASLVYSTFLGRSEAFSEGTEVSRWTRNGECVHRGAKEGPTESPSASFVTKGRAIRYGLRLFDDSSCWARIHRRGRRRGRVCRWIGADRLPNGHAAPVIESAHPEQLEWSRRRAPA